MQEEGRSSGAAHLFDPPLGVGKLLYYVAEKDV